MGHVDHGKTTLLDYIRKTNIASREAGGITQSIGAYEIVHVAHEPQTNADKTQNDADGTQHGSESGPRKSASSPRESAPTEGRRMTFIDTPGHEAFSKMRSRGATVADLAILVVAADDGVKPQTAESIKILLETKTPFVVAITKTDKNTADIERVKSDLAAAGVLLEGYGGSVSFQPVSAKTGEHVDDLLDLLLLATDLENLTYDPQAPASGFVIETKMDRRRGLEATVIVTNGTLKHATPICTKTAQGNIRILENFLGEPRKELVPSSPALVIGFERLPQVGEQFSAGTISELFEATAKGNSTRTVTSANVAPDARPNCLRVIVKASDSGSLEALYEIVKAMAIEKPIQIVGDAVGEVNDNDVKLAISTKAVIIAFRSKTDKTAKMLAEANKIEIISSDIIYDLTRAIEEHVTHKLTPTSQGELEVLALFNAPKQEKQLVGGKVTHGTIRVKAPFILKREGMAPVKGRIMSIKQQKKEMSEVGEGNECGIVVSAGAMIAVGDKIIVDSE
jgi:translation initiation factor IF-2